MFLTDGQSTPIYTDGTLKIIPTMQHARCSNEWRLQSKYRKVEYLLKHLLGNMQNIPVLVGNTMDMNPPQQTTLRKVIGELMQKHYWCMVTVTLQKIGNYSRNNLKITPHGSDTNRNKPALAATKSALRPSIYMVRRKRLTPGYPVMNPSQQKGMGKTRLKNLRMRRIMQFRQRMEALMVLTT